MSKQALTSFPKEKINILFLENISEKAVQQFKQNGYANVKKIAGALSEDELIKEIKDVHLIGIRSKTQITPKVLAAAKKLQAIGCFCIGVNQVDIKAASKKGVVVFNAPYSNTRSVAELVIGISVMLIRRISDKNMAAHNGIWMKEAKGSFELRGKTLGLIGYGNIGSQVSVLAEAIGMKVMFYDTETKLPLGNAVPAKNLKELLSASDIVSLHVPETAQTKNLINKKAPLFEAQAVFEDGSINTFKLKDYLGKKIVLYFYPKDMTPGCTAESGEFRDNIEAFTKANTLVVGVSRDSLKSHDNFRSKLQLPFELVADTEEKLCQIFGVMKMKNMYGKQVRGVERSTFLFDSSGNLVKEWRGLKVPGHVTEVLQAAQAAK